jgi:hypothetical protein
MRSEIMQMARDREATHIACAMLAEFRYYPTSIQLTILNATCIIFFTKPLKESRAFLQFVF